MIALDPNKQCNFVRNIKIMLKKITFRALLLTACWVSGVNQVMAVLPPIKKHVHIELNYETKEGPKSVSNPASVDIVPYSFFYLADIYTNKEWKISSSPYKPGSTAIDFDLNHPLYDEINPLGRYRIPFYVEPGDSLIINVTKAGQVKSYKRTDGKNVKYENMLRHDISNNIFYTNEDFRADKKNTRFPDFVTKVVRKMNVVVDSVNRNADKYGFTDEERRIATNNVKLQFALWIFEYAPYKTMEMNVFARQNSGGWQTTPDEEINYADLSNPSNYSFMQMMPLNDPSCMASKYFPMFIRSYEHAFILNCDQYLFYGTTKRDMMRMDSAYIAKDLKLTGHLAPSMFMNIAMARRYMEDEQLPNDGSIRLEEVQVLGSWQTDDFKGLSDLDISNAKLNSTPTYNFLSPTYWFYDRKRAKAKERATKLIKQIEAEEEAEQSERDAIMKAYEEMQNKK